MALSIKNQKAEQLAYEVAQLTQETMTDAVIHSLEERLEKLKGRRMANLVLDKILDISKSCSSLPDVDSRSPEEILSYNDQGVFS